MSPFHRSVRVVDDEGGGDPVDAGDELVQQVLEVGGGWQAPPPEQRQPPAVVTVGLAEDGAETARATSMIRTSSTIPAKSGRAEPDHQVGRVRDRAETCRVSCRDRGAVDEKPGGTGGTFDHEGEMGDL